MIGQRRPTSWYAPPFVSSAGQEAIECATLAGLHLDEWQRFVLDKAQGEREDGKWSAFEVGAMVSRQNGKGGILEARMLAGMYAYGERLIIYSAHEFATSLEAFRRLLELIEAAPDFDRRVKRVSRAHGEEGIELKGGQRVRFRTRTKAGGRGFTGDLVILDEAMILPTAAHSVLVPTMSARPNPQLWYTGSAVDRSIHLDGVVFSRVRERGLRGDDPELAWFEWAAQIPVPDGEMLSPEHVTAEIAADPRAWAQANPALGIRITAEHVARERRSLDRRSFAVERLGVGDWADTSEGDEWPIPREQWEALVDPKSTPQPPLWFAFDVSPDRQHAAIAVAACADGLKHIEVVETGRGTGWLEERLVELLEHRPAGFVCDELGPAVSLLPALRKRGVKVQTTSAAEMAAACGMLADGAEKQTLRHLGQVELADALSVAAKRKLGDRWAWSRGSSRGNITPLVAVTLAGWAAETQPPRAEPFAMSW